MNKILKVIVSLIIFFFSSGIGQSQTWITRRISNNSGQSSEPNIAIDGNNVYIVWEDNTYGNSDIFFRSSKNGGATWSLKKNISNNATVSGMPDIAVSGSSIYIVWTDEAKDNYELFFRRSNDGGVTWSNTKRITYTRYSSFWPSIAVNDKQVYIAWADYSPGNWKIYFIKSNDRGVNWTPVKRLTYTPGNSWLANIAIEGYSIYLVWLEDSSGSRHVYFNKSINGGKSWNPTSTFEGNGGLAIDIAAIESNLDAVWDDYGLIFSISNDQGESWTDPKRLSYGATFGLEVKVDELLKVYIVYADRQNGNWAIFLKYSKN